ncbi:MAG: calcium/sodium antiporter [bacterium]
MTYWIAFIVCSAVIIYSGTNLSKYGDIIAEKSGLGRTWIGLLLMASVTSLPELITGISSVTYADTPNIAVGDVLGSCMFNILILAMLDLAHHKTPILSKTSLGNVLSAAFGILLMIMVVTSILFVSKIPLLGWLSVHSIFIVLIYFIAVRIIFQYEKKQMSEFINDMALKYEDITKNEAVFYYSINAVFVIAAAFFLPKIGEHIALSTGLGQTFIGNILIASTTSFPEIVVSFAAVKIGAIDLAVSNLFGSNIFNIFILAIDDALFFKGNLLAYADKTHIVSGIAAIAMTSIAIVDIVYKPVRKRFFLDYSSWGIIIIYLFSIANLYILR